MKKLSVFSLIFSFLFILSCEDKKDTTPPEVTITSPSNDSKVNEVVTVTCMSTDNKEVTKVELWVDGVNTGLTDETEPYSFKWNTTEYKDGDHTLIVRGYDSSDNEGDSPPVKVIVENKDSIPPVVTILNPENGSTVSILVTINCISSDNKGVEKVELWIDGKSTGLIDETEPYSLEWNTITYDDGSYLATVRSYDTSGNTTDSDPITLNVVKTITFGNEDYSLEGTTSIDCNDCGHNGDIPNEIGYMTNLKNLTIMNNNQITGNIPTEIGNLTKLESLVFVNNKQMSGEIPSEIGNLINLEDLQLQGNQLTGSIPSNIGSLTTLTSLTLSGNQLTGEIPSEIGYLTNLQNLRLQDNLLTGVIPESICDLRRTLSSNGNINVNRNQLCPPYPTCLENLNLIGTQDTSNCG